jgi:mRNA interferase MazF
VGDGAERWEGNLVKAKRLFAPRRGDAVWITLDPQAGHEQRGRRPALVLSPEAYNKKVGLALFCPITNQVKGYPFEVALPDGLAVTGVVLSDQAKCLDWKARQCTRICEVPDAVVVQVLRRVGVLVAPRGKC